MAKLDPIQSERLYERIVGQIEKLILSNELKIDEKLPSEREMADHFGVSRTAVREAVKALREKGLVEVYPGRGTFIINSTSQAMRNSMGLMMKIGQKGGDLIEVREILEPEIAALAAVRISEEHLEEIRNALIAMDSATGKAEAFIEADLRFHQSLAKATGNDILLNLVHSLVDLRREHFMRLFYVPGNAEQAQREHRIIVNAVGRHDPEAARHAMRIHLARVRREGAEFAKLDYDSALPEQ